MKKTAVTLSLVLCSACALLAGDVLTLKNNLMFEGTVTRIRNCEVVFKVGKMKYFIPAEEIQWLQFEDVSNKIYLEYLERNQQDNPCLKGTLDAQNLHGKRAGHFILGVLFGPFAILGTALSKPTPFRSTQTMALSQNKELFSDPEYLMCYKKKAKGSLIGMEAAGWGAWILFAVIVSAANAN